MLAHPTRRRPPAASIPLLLAAVLASASGCSSSAPAALPACHSPQPAVLPHTAGSLTQSDTGTYCLAVGQTLDIFLTAPAPGASARWSPVTIADGSILGYGSNSAMTPPINVTPGAVVGLARGATTLSSALPNGTKWTATIVVS